MSVLPCRNERGGGEEEQEEPQEEVSKDVTGWPRRLQRRVDSDEEQEDETSVPLLLPQTARRDEDGDATTATIAGCVPSTGAEATVTDGSTGVLFHASIVVRVLSRCWPVPRLQGRRSECDYDGDDDDDSDNDDLPQFDSTRPQRHQSTSVSRRMNISSSFASRGVAAASAALSWPLPSKPIMKRAAADACVKP
ncbi:unnamed protein product [Soboliphyme baturini]|uniref:Uncharacterized protein n=1 Tax=Soboliphyme baturini TaxID=241478 RepID=A0A183IE01_9BILA|nr:unnamed protein product [Soboliphyme baturini]